MARNETKNKGKKQTVKQTVNKTVVQATNNSKSNLFFKKAGNKMLIYDEYTGKDIGEVYKKENGKSVASGEFGDLFKNKKIQFKINKEMVSTYERYQPLNVKWGNEESGTFEKTSKNNSCVFVQTGYSSSQSSSQTRGAEETKVLSFGKNTNDCLAIYDNSKSEVGVVRRNENFEMVDVKVSGNVSKHDIDGRNLWISFNELGASYNDKKNIEIEFGGRTYRFKKYTYDETVYFVTENHFNDIQSKKEPLGNASARNKSATNESAETEKIKTSDVKKESIAEPAVVEFQAKAKESAQSNKEKAKNAGGSADDNGTEVEKDSEKKAEKVDAIEVKKESIAEPAVVEFQAKAKESAQSNKEEDKIADGSADDNGTEVEKDSEKKAEKADATEVKKESTTEPAVENQTQPKESAQGNKEEDKIADDAKAPKDSNVHNSETKEEKKSETYTLAILDKKGKEISECSGSPDGWIVVKKDGKYVGYLTKKDNLGVKVGFIFGKDNGKTFSAVMKDPSSDQFQCNLTYNFKGEKGTENINIRVKIDNSNIITMERDTTDKSWYILKKGKRINEGKKDSVENALRGRLLMDGYVLKRTDGGPYEGTEYKAIGINIKGEQYVYREDQLEYAKNNIENLSKFIGSPVRPIIVSNCSVDEIYTAKLDSTESVYDVYQGTKKVSELLDHNSGKIESIKQLNELKGKSNGEQYGYITEKVYMGTSCYYIDGGELKYIPLKYIKSIDNESWWNGNKSENKSNGDRVKEIFDDYKGKFENLLGKIDITWTNDYEDFGDSNFSSLIASICGGTENIKVDVKKLLPSKCIGTDEEDNGVHFSSGIQQLKKNWKDFYDEVAKQKSIAEPGIAKLSIPGVKNKGTLGALLENQNSQKEAAKGSEKKAEKADATEVKKESTTEPVVENQTQPKESAQGNKEGAENDDAEALEDNEGKVAQNGEKGTENPLVAELKREDEEYHSKCNGISNDYNEFLKNLEEREDRVSFLSGKKLEEYRRNSEGNETLYGQMSRFLKDVTVDGRSPSSGGHDDKENEIWKNLHKNMVTLREKRDGNPGELTNDDISNFKKYAKEALEIFSGIKTDLEERVQALLDNHTDDSSEGAIIFSYNEGNAKTPEDRRFLFSKLGKLCNEKAIEYYNKFIKELSEDEKVKYEKVFPEKFETCSRVIYNMSDYLKNTYKNHDFKEKEIEWENRIDRIHDIHSRYKAGDVSEEDLKDYRNFIQGRHDDFVDMTREFIKICRENESAAQPQAEKNTTPEVKKEATEVAVGDQLHVEEAGKNATTEIKKEVTKVEAENKSHMEESAQNSEEETENTDDDDTSIYGSNDDDSDDDDSDTEVSESNEEGAEKTPFEEFIEVLTKYQNELNNITGKYNDFLISLKKYEGRLNFPGGNELKSYEYDSEDDLKKLFYAQMMRFLKEVTVDGKHFVEGNYNANLGGRYNGLVIRFNSLRQKSPLTDEDISNLKYYSQRLFEIFKETESDFEGRVMALLNSSTISNFNIEDAKTSDGRYSLLLDLDKLFNKIANEYYNNFIGGLSETEKEKYKEIFPENLSYIDNIICDMNRYLKDTYKNSVFEKKKKEWMEHASDIFYSNMAKISEEDVKDHRGLLQERYNAFVEMTEKFIEICRENEFEAEKILVKEFREALKGYWNGYDSFTDKYNKFLKSLEEYKERLKPPEGIELKSYEYDSKDKLKKLFYAQMMRFLKEVTVDGKHFVEDNYNENLTGYLYGISDKFGCLIDKYSKTSSQLTKEDISKLKEYSRQILDILERTERTLERKVLVKLNKVDEISDESEKAVVKSRLNKQAKQNRSTIEKVGHTVKRGIIKTLRKVPLIGEIPGIKQPNLNKLRNCYKDAAEYICSCTETVDGLKLLSKFKSLSSVTAYKDWYKCLNKLFSKNSDKSEALAKLFVSFIGLKSESVVSACEGLKLGDIDKKSKEDVIQKADIIRNNLKNFCRGKDEVDLKNKVRTLLLTYNFSTGDKITVYEGCMEEKKGPQTSYANKGFGRFFRRLKRTTGVEEPTAKDLEDLGDE